MTNQDLLSSKLSPSKASPLPAVKCVVWDLDDTLWQGILLEGGAAQLRPGVREAVEELDRRGILQSIASRNDRAAAISKLNEFGLAEYFLYPQIVWAEKSASMSEIARRLNIGIDSIVFLDNDPFEREEVQSRHPQVRCFDPVELTALLNDSQFNSPVSRESSSRRLLYRADMQRQEEEESFSGTKHDFLAGLKMVFRISRSVDADLDRAAELTERTHQLNTTGYTYSRDELKALSKSSRHALLMCSLEDRYGSYGAIGLTLIEYAGSAMLIKLLLMSCRVMSRGVGSILLFYLMHQATLAKLDLLAEFLPTDRNRPMYLTYKFAGFCEHAQSGDIVILRHDLRSLPSYPDYVEIHSPEKLHD
jgi:FkbH-like protein